MGPRGWLLLGAVWAFGCGPELGGIGAPTDWVMAGLSNRRADFAEALDVGHWEFHDDGTVTVTGFSTAGECGNTTRTTEYLWTDAGSGAIEVTDLDGGAMDGGGGSSWDRVIFQLSERCSLADGSQPVDLIRFKDGDETSRDDDAYVRGKVCLKPEGECPAGEFCSGLGCRTVWCDGDPPDPFDCGS